MCDSDIYINGVTWRNKNETESYPKTNKFFANVIYERTDQCRKFSQKSLELPILISTCLAARAAVVTSTINNVGKNFFFSQLRSTKAASAHSKKFS